MMILEGILSAIVLLLKILGILLLAILLLVLVILGTVLFVPVRYKGNAVFDTVSDTEKFSGAMSVTWLLHLLSVKVWFENNRTCYYAKIFGIKLINSEKLKKEKKPKKKKEKEKKKKGTEQSEKPAQATENFREEKHRTEEPEDKVSQIEESEGEKSVENAERKVKVTFFEKIYAKFDKIKFKILEICDKIKNVNSIKDNYVAFLTAQESKQAIGDIKQQLFKLLCHLKPTGLRAKIIFGFTDPATTGEVYGVLCLLLVSYGKSVDITPEFTGVEKTFIQGSLKLKGRIRVAALLIRAIKIYRNKRLKEFITFVKEKGNKNGR